MQPHHFTGNHVVNGLDVQDVAHMEKDGSHGIPAVCQDVVSKQG